MISSYDVACPRCGAKPNERCRALRGPVAHYIQNAHRQRREAALEAQDQATGKELAGALVRFPKPGHEHSEQARVFKLHESDFVFVIRGHKTVTTVYQFTVGKEPANDDQLAVVQALRAVVNRPSVLQTVHDALDEGCDSRAMSDRVYEAFQSITINAKGGDA